MPSNLKLQVVFNDEVTEEQADQVVDRLCEILAELQITAVAFLYREEIIADGEEGETHGEDS